MAWPGSRLPLLLLVLAGSLVLAPAVGAVSPRGTGLIAFACSGPPDYTHRICTAEPDGSGLRRILPGALHPSWSPDGARLAFSHDDPDSGETWIGIARGDASDRRDRVIPGSAPSWSPDGELVYVDRSGNVAVANPDTGESRRVTTDAGMHQQSEFEWISTGYGDPVWSPTGEWIAVVFGASRCQAPPGDDRYYCQVLEDGLWTLSPDGRQRRQVVDGPAFEPAWFPYGTALAFVLDGDVMKVSAEGGNAVPMGPRGHNPAVSPDGRMLALEQSGSDPVYGPGTELQVSCLDGSRPRTLFFGALGFRPNWQPTAARSTAGRCRPPAAELASRTRARCGRTRCRLRLVGSLEPPDWRPCGGHVSLAIRVDGRIRTRRSRVAASCRFAVRLSWRSRSSRRRETRLTLRHLGSAWLGPGRAQRTAVRVRG
jgi:hypothetical protein